MSYLAFALAFCVGIGATMFLVLEGHPWFALAILLVTAGISIREGDAK